ncbi:MAG: phospho-N-acetylmuramoyl-pentapeptide-transferase [Phycisphaerales bacterium]|nr:phospho-N-acetylmuramoyl-pentapeptide-transferase [Phycisphaerales bacterium]
MFTLFDLFGREVAVQWGLYWVLQVLDQNAFRAFFAAVMAFFVVLALGRRTIRWLREKKIGDAGVTDAAALREIAYSKKDVPTMGGILIVGSILATTLTLANLSNFYVLLAIVVMLWLAVLGGFDDWLKLTAQTRGSGRQGLYGWEKLVFQFGLGVLVAYFAFNHGRLEPPADGAPAPALDGSMAHVLCLPFQKTYESGIGTVADGLWYLPMGLYIVLGVLMIAGLSNAVNITDGMDGLAAGCTATVSLGLLLLAAIAGTQGWAHYLLVPFVPQTDELAVVAGAMMGACLGFLWFNCSPAAVFMGDTGSLALGGLIGYIAMVVRQEIIVLAMCGIFLAEIGSVVLQVGYFKATKGKRIFLCAPYHHHLHRLGWPEPQVVTRLWIVAVLLVVLSLATLKLR